MRILKSVPFVGRGTDVAAEGAMKPIDPLQALRVGENSDTRSPALG